MPETLPRIRAYSTAVVALRTLVASLTSVGGSVGLVGCVLLVSPERFGDTCHFSGEQTQCGACIVERCQSAVDACCKDDACAATLGAVESCASRRDDACTTIVNDASRFAIAACVTEKCGGVCVALHGSPQTSCKSPVPDDSAACACTYGSGTNDDQLCGSAAYPQTLCCAPRGWPAVGLGCTCRPVECNPTSDGCFCLTVDTTPSQRECAGAICCAEDDTCSCGSTPCLMFQTQVPRCNLAALACRSGQMRVDTCSVRSP